MNMNMHTPDSVVDSYVAGHLAADQKLAVDTHASACDECLRELTLAALSLRVHTRIRKLMFEEDANSVPI